jgi:hypothetical protein
MRIIKVDVIKRCTDEVRVDDNLTPSTASCRYEGLEGVKNSFPTNLQGSTAIIYRFKKGRKSWYQTFYEVESRMRLSDRSCIRFPAMV